MTGNTGDTAGAAAVCANCGAAREPGESFCEVCGLDFATGKLPAAPPAPQPAAELAPVEWVVVVSVDEEFFASNQPEGGSLTLPADPGDREVPLHSGEALVGRAQPSANVYPDVDLGADPGVSRRHASLKRRDDGTWAVVDLDSTNGTRVDGTAITAGEERPLAEGVAVHVGAWTRLTLKRVAPA